MALSKGNQGGECDTNGNDSSAGQLMTRVHARLVHLPPTCCITSLAAVDASDGGKIVQLTGTVVRASPVQMYESAQTYQCTGKHGCGRTCVEYADLEHKNNALVKPESCPLSGEGGERCKGTKLTPVGSVHTDYQDQDTRSCIEYWSGPYSAFATDQSATRLGRPVSTGR